MGQISKVLRHNGDSLIYWCQGCGYEHQIRIAPAEHPCWQWNGDADRPTFTPSILIRSGHYASGQEPGTDCWCTFRTERIAAGGDPGPFACGVCHVFITDGVVRFLPDCTHALAGQELPLPELPERPRDSAREAS